MTFSHCPVVGELSGGGSFGLEDLGFDLDAVT